MRKLKTVLLTMLLWTGAHAQVKWEHVTGKPAFDSLYVSLAGSYVNPNWISSIEWGKLTGLPSSFTPSTHASSHGVAGSDAVTLAQSQVTSLELDLSNKAAATHEHVASDITSGALAAAQGGLGADASAFSGFVRMSGATATASAIANADLPDAFDVSAKTSTKPAKDGTVLPVTCDRGEQFFKTDATPGENLHLCTSSNTWSQVVGGGGGGSVTTYSVASYTETFTSQTSVTIAHNFGTLKQVIGCVDGSNVLVKPDRITLGTASSVVTFNDLQTGKCTAIGGTGLYDEAFTSQTSINLDHDFNTYNVVVRCYDGSENVVEPNSVAAAGLNDTTVTFTGTQSGHCVVAATLAIAEGGGGSGTVTSVALALPAEITVSGSPVTASGTLTGAWATQTANTVFAGPTSGGAATPAFRAIVQADLPVMTGDSGSGGVKGAVPAPASGDAAAGKYLKADGTWAVPPGGSGGGDSTILTASGTLSSWGTLAANSCTDKNLTLTGAVSGDSIAPGWPSTLEAGIMGMLLPGTDVVVVRLCNVTGSGVAVADGKTFKATIVRPTA